MTEVLLGSTAVGLVWGWLFGLFTRDPWEQVVRSALGWAFATAAVAAAAWIVAPPAALLWFVAGGASSWAIAMVWYRAIATRHVQ